MIVIDALDECKDEEPASAILSVLARFVSDLPRVKFFLTGRPEPRIRAGFRLPLLAEVTDIFILHNVEPSLINSDIKLFFKHGFQELTHHRPGLDSWPTEEQLDLLCKRAAGLFVFAAATIKFLDHRNNDPRGQLDLLLQSQEHSSLEGDVELKEGATLDSLYTSILQGAFGKDHPRDDPKVRSVLGAVVLAANPLSPSSIATLFGLHAQDVFLRLSSAHSLLILEEDINYPVQPFHKSFPDFIIDSTRCTSQRFQISPSDHHLELLIGCLELMNKTLKKNMCNLPEAVRNSEVPDLKERREKYISHALEYACKSWHKHLLDSHTTQRPKITSALHHLLENKFLCWLEILSILGNVRDAIDALEVAAKWVEVGWVSVFNELHEFTDLNQESRTLDLINDCFRLVTGFFEVINLSAPHIYHSVLPLSPKESMVQTLYRSQINPLARVIQGAPVEWESSFANAIFLDEVEAAVWSSCSRFIAVAIWGSDKVIVLDGATLEQLHTMHPQSHDARWDKLIFSPDSHLLTAYYSTDTSNIVSWDLQTGGLISSISMEGAEGYKLITYSECGTMLGVLFNKNTIITYNTSSGIQISSCSIQQSPVTIWTHGEHLQFATIESRSITIWQVSFISNCAPTQVGSLPTPDNLSMEEPVFLPSLNYLAFIHQGRVVVWDAQHQKSVLNSTDIGDIQNISFSPNGNFLACGTNGPQFYLWKKSPDEYLLHGTHMSNVKVATPVISPSRESIITSGNSVITKGGSILQLWHATHSSNISAQPSQQKKDFLLEFFPNQPLVAVTQRLGKVVSILDIKSGNPQLVIDAGTEICGIGVIGRKFIVVCDRKIITWELPVGDCTSNIQWNVENSVQTTEFEHPQLVEQLHASISPDLNYVAIGSLVYYTGALSIYDIHTGEQLVAAGSMGSIPEFTPNGNEVCCVTGSGIVDKWAIVKDDGSKAVVLENIWRGRKVQSGLSWHSSCGCQVTDDGWVVDSRGKQLLWLPHQWQSTQVKRRWSGKFLAVFPSGLTEPLILELEV